jgi:hypothetical protein
VPLVSQAEYARRNGIDRAAVYRRTRDAGGPIPTYGADKKLDQAEADRLWASTMTSQALANSRHPAAAGKARTRRRRAADPPAADPAAPFGPHAAAQARTATLLAEAQLRRLRLEERRGQLVDRQATLSRVFAFVRGSRDAWLAWPARVAAELGAELGLEQTRVAIALEAHVRRHLDELAAARFELPR